MHFQWKTILIAGAAGFSLPIFLIFFLPWLHAFGMTTSPDQLRDWSMFLMQSSTQAVCAVMGLAIGVILIARKKTAS